VGVRILHVSDVHCATGLLRRVLESVAYDVAVCSGDFECVETAEAFVEEAGEAVAVTGNMDSERVREVLASGGVLADGRVAERAGLRFAGVGGLTPWADIDALKGVDGGVDVLVSHHPPYGHLDEGLFGGHAGLRGLLELHQLLRPRVHLFGHIHEARGCERLEGLVLVNAGPLAQGYYALVTLDASGRVEVSLKRL
jgi:Icc-related predicted phosphoesterase